MSEAPTTNVRKVVGWWLIRWGLPALAMGLGAILVTTMGLRLACNCFAGDRVEAVLTLLVSLFFAGAGFVALLLRVRGQDFAANAAVMAMGLAVMLLMILQSSGGLLAINRPHRLVSGELVQVLRSSHRGGLDFSFTLADGRAFAWACEYSDCHGRDVELSDLRSKTPMAAQFEVAADRVVGLRIADVQILDPAREVTRQSADALKDMFLFGLALAVLVFIAWAGWRRQMVRREA